MYHGFNYVAASVVAVGALVIAGGIGVVGIVLGPLGQMFEGPSSAERQRLDLMRVHQRAMLEELDDIIELLEEIRDVLKAVEE